MRRSFTLTALFCLLVCVAVCRVAADPKAPLPEPSPQTSADDDDFDNEDLENDAETKIAMEHDIQHEILEQKLPGSAQAAGSRRRRSSDPVLPDLFWQKAIIPYTVPHGETTRSQMNYEYTRNALQQQTCLLFVPYTNSTRADYGLDHDGYCKFNRKSSPLSQFGNDHPGQTVSCSSGNCIHEVFHLVGFQHDQKFPTRRNFMRINWRNVSESKLSQFSERPGGWQNKLGIYDITSSLHYRLTNETVTMTSYFPELKYDRSDYYKYKEVSEKYKCKEYFCSDFSGECENHGYVMLYDRDHDTGRCGCMCPAGLDPDTKCTTILTTTNDGPYPGGSYALPKHRDGCPPGFSDGELRHQFQDTFIYSPNTLATTATRGENILKQRFCVHTGQEGGAWPPGAYCIHRVGGTCPDKFREGWVQFANHYTSDGPGRAETEGSVPDGEFNRHTKLFFCCRSDGDLDVPLALPNTTPFALLPFKSDCPKVTGMRSRQGMYYVQNSNTEGEVTVSGPVPHFSGHTSMWPFYCTYQPVDRNCGGVMELSASNKRVTITSPGFPNNYASNLQCNWFIKGPENSTLLLKFRDFDVKYDKGCDDDYLEINTYLFSGEGQRFCGNRLHKTFISIRNTLRLSLNTQSADHRGFKANVELILKEDNCLNPDDHGSSYRGHVDFTRDFQPCLPWSDPALIANKCLHFATNPMDITDGLDGNFCRNPGDGLLPWCYVNATHCQRSYCDVCQYGQPYDASPDCASLLASDSRFCLDSADARSKCALSCADLFPPVTRQGSHLRHHCPTPHHPADGEPETRLRSSYTPGSKVSFRCSAYSGSSRVRTTTCLDDGTWTPLRMACSGCQDGWVPFGSSCVWSSHEPLSYKQAQLKCRSLGSQLFEVRDQETMDFVFRLRDDGRTVWLGLSMEDGEWRWQDGTSPVWTKWDGSQDSDEDCGILVYTNQWEYSECTSTRDFLCREVAQEPMPEPYREPCTDEYSSCVSWTSGGYCTSDSYGSFMRRRCKLSCGFCPAPQECQGSPCGDSLCTVVDSDGTHQCTCTLGHHGSDCSGRVDCVDEASEQFCQSKLQENPDVCHDFGELGWHLCRTSCNNCI